MITVTAAEARPGDVLLDSSGACWQRGSERYLWCTFTGPVLFEGPWSDEYGPHGVLVLLARDGRPAEGGDRREAA